MRLWCRALLGIAGISAVDAHAHEGDPPPTPEDAAEDVDVSSVIEVDGEVITIVEEVTTEEAAEQRITNKELGARPRRTPGQLLMATPGLFVGQHAGGGKADQIFLRGFDADHGTDVAIFVDGMPVNMVSHAHGQGYADLHFVIPEVVDHIHVSKGPYVADAGDFATAGVVRLQTVRRLYDSFVTAEGGSFDTFRLAGATGGTRGIVDGWIATELYHTNGPFDHDQRLRRHNLMGKVTLDLGDASVLWFEAMSYGGGWNASGQIPLREVEAGRLSRFGAVDPTEGGISSRQSIAAGWLSHPAEGKDDLELRAYAINYRLDLHSDFTFFKDDRVLGDGIEQVDDRRIVGVAAEHRRRREVRGVELGSRLGIETRDDDAEVALYHQSERDRLGVRNAAHVNETSISAFAEASIGTRDRWRVTLGGRADLFTFVVDRALGDATNGSTKRAIANPKLRAEAAIASVGDVRVIAFANGGGGFHSNDARNVVANPGDEATLPRAWGADVGVRARERGRRFELALAAWGLWMERELVWVGDAGEVEARGATRRLGVEALARVKLLPWLVADVEATFAHARFDDGGRIPLAPPLTIAGGIAWRHPIGISGSLRARHLADRPAEESGLVEAEGYTVLDLVASLRRGSWQIDVAVDNLTDTEWREAQFYFESRLADEAAPVADIHFTPGVPLSARASLTYWF